MTGTSSENPGEFPAPGSYRVDPIRSTIRYTGRHLFGLGDVRATFAVTAGIIGVADPATASWAQLSVDPASFTSDKTRRDSHVKSKALLDVEHYPQISFRSMALRAEGNQWRVTGEVTAHGSTEPVEIIVDRATAAGPDIRIHATAHLDRYAFGVTGVKGMAGRQVTLEFDLRAVAAPTSVGSA